MRRTALGGLLILVAVAAGCSQQPTGHVEMVDLPNGNASFNIIGSVSSKCQGDINTYDPEAAATTPTTQTSDMGSLYNAIVQECPIQGVDMKTPSS